MRKIAAAVISIALLLNCATLYPQDLWTNKDGGIRNVEARAMLIAGRGIYLATKNEVYRTLDAKDRWQPIFSLPAGDNEITCLDGNGKFIFVGTRRGLFRSQDYGRSWKNIFRTILPEKNNVLCVEMARQNPKKILIGTEKGIFASDDTGGRWNDISGILKNKRVNNIALDKSAVFICGDEGLYVMKDGSAGWERIYVRRPLEKRSLEESSDAASEEESGVDVNCIAIKGARVYIGVGRNIIYSDDHGKLWHPFAARGLSGTIVCIAISEKRDLMYCATTKGVFEFSKNDARWMELYKGMDRAVSVNKIIFDGDSENSLWALADKGLYKLESGRYAHDQYIDVERNLKSMKIAFDNEPSFRQLQQAALKFNEVSPDKIRLWRDQARIRALLPKVSLGMDKNRSTNTEIYTSATKEYAVVGPDDFSNGFDLSISWELGDLIWSDDQTNIDVRSRLTTQLRNDILDDLRRVYYERKRLQFELMTNPPQEGKARFDKEMRIQELSQAIDDLTGNYLSDHMKKSADTV